MGRSPDLGSLWRPWGTLNYRQNGRTGTVSTVFVPPPSWPHNPADGLILPHEHPLGTLCQCGTLNCRQIGTRPLTIYHSLRTLMNMIVCAVMMHQFSLLNVHYVPLTNYQI